jgi:hypothetical protein
MIWNLIGIIWGKVLDIVDDVVEDKDAANKLKFQIQKQLLGRKGTELEAQAKIFLAEAQGSWLQRNWRPMLEEISPELGVTDAVSGTVVAEN